jgi:hypothetical protein
VSARDGVLEVVVPKAADAHARRIPVRGGAGQPAITGQAATTGKAAGQAATRGKAAGNGA